MVVLPSAGTLLIVKLNRIIRKRLLDSEGKPIGDVNAAVAVNVGEAGGSESHVSSHTRIVQSSRSSTQVHTTSESSTRPAPPTEAGEPKEAT